MPDSHPRWTLQVSSFGRIKRAEIQSAPLILLIGRNNTGKSYMASLLWALLNSNELLLRQSAFRPTNTDQRDLPDWFKHAISSVPDADGTIIDLSANEFAKWFNRIIESRQQSILQSVFAWKGVSARSIKMKFEDDAVISVLKKPYEGGELEPGIGAGSYGVDKLEDGRERFMFSLAGDTTHIERMIMRDLAARIVNWAADSEEGQEPIYIPAARTGFMLAIQQIISGLFDSLQVSDDSTRPGALPLPLVRFLRIITGPVADKKQPTADIATFLENAIIGGRVERRDAPVPAFDYRPKNRRLSIPLRAASSMVTELAPFLFLLRHVDLSRGLVFEEPEAHLHIAAQRSMARAIARLVSRGIPVVVTTHSDTFLQQINLLISLHGDEDRQELMDRYGYTDEDLIDPKQAGAYEFIIDDADTTVRAAQLTELGFIVPSINEVLANIAEEALEIQA